MVPKGRSVHVGINEVDRNAFPSTTKVPKLNSCEKDAESMSKLAAGAGFEPPVLLRGKEATFDRVEKEVLKAAAALNDGDIFLFTFAGHGTEEPNESGGQNQTIVLFDLIMFDHFIQGALWSQFNRGVRIVGVADSCHSGTAFLATLLKAGAEFMARFAEFFTGGRNETAMPRAGQPRRIDPSARDEHLNDPRFAPAYAEINKSIPTGDDAKLKAELLTLAACLDGQETLDGLDENQHGVFTQALLDSLEAATPPSHYDGLIKSIADLLKAQQLKQNPLLTPRKGPNPLFRSRPPFSI